MFVAFLMLVIARCFLEIRKSLTTTVVRGGNKV